MIKSIFIIFIFQLIGEVIQKYFELTIPGPVIGLLLLLTSLLLFNFFEINFFKTKIEPELTDTSESLLDYLPLLFVPIGVGVVMHISFLENSLLRVLAVIFFGTLLTIGFTAFLMDKISKS